METDLTSIHEDGSPIPGLTHWVGDWCCPELWCRLQVRLGSGVAVALVWAGGYSSNLTPSLGTSIWRGCGPKKTKKKKEKADCENKLCSSLKKM